jgi:hypothetical protein
MKIVIVGGGWAGCTAALTARKAGAEVVLYERTDILLGVGNVGGIMRNNGRFTAAEELIALGAGDFINITDSNAKHRNINFPEHNHAWLCDISRIEPSVRRYLLEIGIDIKFSSRVSNVKMEGSKILGLVLSDNSFVEGDVFIDATGSTGPMHNCSKYGNGCVMCVLRCPSFGGRVSISEKAGVTDISGERNDGSLGAFSGSFELSRDSISEELLKELDTTGSAIIKIPAEDINLEKLTQKVCQQYALPEFAENLILLDTGHIKLMTSYYPIEKLRKLPGLENASYIDPYSGGKGNSIRYLAASPRTNSMKVIGVDNLFCAGEKSGFIVGHTEAMCTGALAGHNAVRYASKLALLVLPESTTVGDFISYSNYRLTTPDGKKVRLTFSGSEYFERMKNNGMYTIDIASIKENIRKLKLTELFSKKLI